MPDYMIFYGKRDTRKYSGKSYDSENFADLEQRIRSPTAFPKEHATAAIFSKYSASDARTAEVQRTSGMFTALVMDVDDGNPSLKILRDAIGSLLGDYRIYIFSSASANVEKRKWRVIVPIAMPLPGVAYTETQKALISCMASRGIALDPALCTPSQPVYLPNIPASRRAACGRPNFYEFLISGDKILPDIELISELRERTSTTVETEETQTVFRSENDFSKGSNPALQKSAVSIINHFNQHHDIVALMLKYGWQHKHQNWYASPFSESKGASVCVVGTKAISFTTSDIGRIGRSNENMRTIYDAFDLYCTFEFAGDKIKAIQAYRRVTGLRERKQLLDCLNRWKK